MSGTRSVAIGALLAAVVLVAGCASMQTTEWTGKKVDEAIKQFGTPDRTVPAANAQTMYVWNKVSEYTTGSWSGTNAVQTTQRRMTTWTMFVNQDGVIVTWNRQESQVY